MAERYTEQEVAKMTTEDVLTLQAEYDKKVKAHKRIRLGLGIAAGILVAGAALTIFPWGAAAFGPAWWAVNGSLTSLALIGAGSAIVARILDRKNIHNLKILTAEKTLREGQLDERNKEKVQQKYVKAYNRGEKHLHDKIKTILRKDRNVENEEEKTVSSSSSNKTDERTL